MQPIDYINLHLIEQNLIQALEGHPNLSRFFDLSGRLIDLKNLKEIVECISDNLYDLQRDLYYSGSRADNLPQEEGSYPYYTKVCLVKDRWVSWQYQYGGGTYDIQENLLYAKFCKCTQRAQVVNYYEFID